MITTEFVLAGRAIFTVSNPHGEHCTYKVSRRDQDRWFVGVLTGPRNTTDYTYLGMLNDQGRLRLTRGSCFTDNARCTKVFRWAMDIVWGHRPLPHGYSIEHVGYCGRCGLTLTTPESLASGFGPECCRKLGIEHGKDTSTGTARQTA